MEAPVLYGDGLGWVTGDSSVVYVPGVSGRCVP